MGRKHAAAGSSEAKRLVRQIAELERHAGEIQEPLDPTELRRRAFYQALIKTRKQQLVALKRQGAAASSGKSGLDGSKDETSEEKRTDFPRVATDLAAELTGPGGHSGRVTVLNVSPRGLGIEFEQQAGQTIFQPDNRIAPGQIVTASYGLPVREPSRVVARYQIVWTSRVDGDKYRMGLQLEGFQGDGHEILERYILSCLQYP